jgi:acetolactate synthase-1/2/3 large subunit
VERAAALLRDAERPVIMAGTGLYWGRGEDALRALAEEQRIPVSLNGLGRGCLPADHELFFSRARGAALAEPERSQPRPVAAELYGSLPATLEALRAAASGGPAHVSSERAAWIASLRATETDRRAGEAADLSDERAPLHPMRVYGELAKLLDRNAIIVGDGGDFVSYAGRVVDSYEPGCWVDPGPYGCLGSGIGYALGAKLARPGRQVVVLLGDGAFGFSGMDLDTLARHGANVVGVMGNNGIWALEKHPMEAIYGYSVAADLRPGTRYDQLADALGCHGELVSRPDELRPALERALGAGRPALVNVLTDPSVAYPRRSNLA